MVYQKLHADLEGYLVIDRRNFYELYSVNVI